MRGVGLVGRLADITYVAEWTVPNAASGTSVVQSCKAGQSVAIAHNGSPIEEHDFVSSSCNIPSVL
jgi:hypothetical protein